MTARSVLVTGVSRDLGALLVRMLADDPRIDQVVGVDTVAPKSDIGRAQFVRADIRNPLIAKVIASEEIDTVVHLNVLPTPVGAGGRTAMKETNVIGSMQLLAACQKAPSIRTLVVRSSAAVYGSSPRDPAVFTEDTAPYETPSAGYAKDAVEVEGYVRGLIRRRPDVAVTVLRMTNLIGTQIETSLTRYLALPLAPTVLGYDPRLQMLHVDDALAVLRQAMDGDRHGIFNVGGDGIVLLSQAVRRIGRPNVPLLPPAVTVVGGLLGRLRLADFSRDQMRFLEHGRAVDTAKLKSEFGYTPRYTTAEAFEDYAAHRPGPLRSAQLALATEQVLLGVLERRRLARA